MLSRFLCLTLTIKSGKIRSRLFSVLQVHQFPQDRKKINERGAAWTLDKRRNDPNFRVSEAQRHVLWREQIRTTDKERHQRILDGYKARAQIPSHKLYMLCRSSRPRDEVIWKNHRPVMYKLKTEHQCGICNRQKLGGVKFWWQRKDDPLQFDCNPCFTSDLSLVRPISYHESKDGKGFKMFSKIHSWFDSAKEGSPKEAETSLPDLESLSISDNATTPPQEEYQDASVSKRKTEA